MAQQNYLKFQNTKSRFNKSINVVDLIKKSKLERLEEKKHTIFFVLASMILHIVVANIIIF